MNQCIQCKTDTKNPKFCSRSCSAIYNNKAFPKRQTSLICKICPNGIWKGRTYCKDCWYKLIAERSIEKWEVATLAEMIGIGNANAGSRYPYIRGLARKKYLQSDKIKACRICDYSLHFEISHIKPIKDFDLSSTVAEINSLDNLQALCRNHHWEFDHGYIF